MFAIFNTLQVYISLFNWYVKLLSMVTNANTVFVRRSLTIHWHLSSVVRPLMRLFSCPLMLETLVGVVILLADEGEEF